MNELKIYLTGDRQFLKFSIFCLPSIKKLWRNRQFLEYCCWTRFHDRLPLAGRKNSVSFDYGNEELEMPFIEA